jgi:PAS domain S-box-containing protein
MDHFRFKLVDKQTITPNTFEYWFELVSKPDTNLTQDSYLAVFGETTLDSTSSQQNTITTTNDFIFKPGQYIWLILDGLRQDDPRGNRRAFSISSSSHEQNTFSILFRGGDSGYKQTLIQLELGWEVSVTRPTGSSFNAAFLPPEGSTPTCLIAGGVGVAPFLSILRTQAHAKTTASHQTLVFLHAHAESAFYDQELKSLCEQTQTNLITQVSNYDLSALSQLDQFHETQFYISGSHKMVQSSYESLAKLGISAQAMHFEQFYPQPKNSIEKFFTQFQQTRQDAQNAQQTDTNPYKLLVDTTSNHLVVTDQNGFILYANQAAQNITGYTFSEMQGNTPRLWGGQMRPAMYKKMWNTLKIDKQPFVGEITNQRKSGERYTAVGRITPIIENDEVIGFVASEEDITERVTTEHKLKESELKFRNLVEKIQDTYMFFTKDTNGFVTYVSPSAHRILGYQPQELQKHITELPFTDNPINQEVSQEGLENRDVYNPTTYEVEVFHKDGQPVMLEITETPETDTYGKLVAIDGIIKDVTSDKQMDRMKTEFISLASHQLRTPLSTISWYLEMLTAGDAGPLNDEQLKFTQEAYIGSKRMVELVNALLNVARIEAGSFMIEPEPTDLVKITRSVLDEFKPLNDIKNLKVVLQKEELPEIPLDPDLIRIVIHNLLTNAIKYTPIDGAINVDIHSVAANTEVGVFMDKPIQTAEESILFSVSDTGFGIPQHEQSKIFTKLYRAENVTKTDIDGTGLGLYIVRHIIEEASGRLWFKSVENEGSTFYILLPKTGMAKRDGLKKLS